MHRHLHFSFPLFFSLVFFLSLPVFGQPVITVAEDQLPDFREVYTGYFSDVQFYHVSAESLNAPLVLRAEGPFRISLDCHDGFTDSLALETDDGEIPLTRIYVRLFPESTGSFDGVIIHQSQDAQSAVLLVSGAGIDTTVPEGYYDDATGTGSLLKTQLHHIIKDHNVPSYSSLWQHFTVTDATFDGHVWDIYSDSPCEEPPYVYTFFEDQDTGVGGMEEGDVYNREHSMPRSWFGGQVNPMHTDLYHIYPVDKFVNARRANFPFGEVDTPEWTFMNGAMLGPNVAGGYTGTAYEPIDDYKGDLARAFLYMITRYENKIEGWEGESEYGDAMLDHNTYPGYEPWVIDMFLDWHEADPVSQKEILRNQAVYEIQGNRNPFVDHPDWVEMIWGDTTVHVTPMPEQGNHKIFPNPVRDQVWVETDSEMLNLKLFAVNGRLIKSAERLRNSVSLCMRALPPGLYFVHINTTEGVIREKVIKK